MSSREIIHKPYAIAGADVGGFVEKHLRLLPSAETMLDGCIEEDRLQAAPAAINRADEGMVRVLGIARLAADTIRVVEEEPIVVPQLITGHVTPAGKLHVLGIDDAREGVVGKRRAVDQRDIRRRRRHACRVQTGVARRHRRARANLLCLRVDFLQRLLIPANSLREGVRGVVAGSHE